VACSWTITESERERGRAGKSLGADSSTKTEACQTKMALNIDSLYEPYSCPPLTDVDYRTASRGGSRRPSRKGSLSPMAPSPVPSQGENEEQQEEKISILDPRRFTPTLHANLVSEILSLRREVESKNSLVLNLEENIAAVKDENSKLQENVSASLKENKSLKRQMDTLEGGTYSAIEDIAKEKDKATEALAELRHRLEASQKKARSHEEDSQRVHAIWERDRDRWEAEKRILERKVHVVEGRLKTVLSEVVATQNSGQPRTSIEGTNRPWSRDRPSSRTSGTRSAASRHRDSFNDANDGKAIRFSNGNAVPGGKTLADELDFDEDSDPDSEGGYMSPEALPEEANFRPRPYSVQSHRQSVKARKLLGLNTDGDEESENGRDTSLSMYAPMPESLEANEKLEAKQRMLAYVDSATQFSPPPSPDLAAQRLSTIDEIDNDSILDDAGTKQTNSSDNELSDLQFPRGGKHIVMVSSACQTVEPPLSPPETPIQTRALDCECDLTKADMVTVSTQTLEEDLGSFGRRYTSPTTDVPVIAIHPVVSDSPRSSIVLPPNSKNASTQAKILGEVRSIAIQTESIRIDERLEKLPPHLYPSIIYPVSPSPSPTPEAQEKDVKKSQSVALRASLQVPRPSSSLKERRKSALSQNSVDRDVSDDDMESLISEDSFLQREPIRKTLSKVQNSWQLVASPTEETANFTDTDEVPKLPDLEFDQFELHSKLQDDTLKSPQQKFEERSGIVLKPINTGGRQKDIRRTALISSGTAAHVQRARSPSEPATLNRGPVPPFPVPDRSSSRKLPWAPSDLSESPTPRSGNSREFQRPGRAPPKRPVMRKSRSAIGTEHQRERSRSRSPTTFDSLTESLSSIPPPLPENEITSPYAASFRQVPRAGSHKKSAPSQTESAYSDQTTVVDSIAQTMIGEWMWKYVRRRKSFGLPDPVGTDHEGHGGDGGMNGGIRHQRWVWVAPYERAVMWSSKQPTSGTALMGKGGRKRKYFPLQK
jgi:hypothetical protein